jgi:hypothetical protein
MNSIVKDVIGMLKGAKQSQRGLAIQNIIRTTDYANHAIITVDELNEAMQHCAPMIVRRTDEGPFLAHSVDGKHELVTAADVDIAYSRYIKKIKLRRPKGANQTSEDIVAKRAESSR